MSRPESPRTFSRIRNIDRVAIGMTLVLMLATAVFVFLEHSLPGPRWFQNKQTVFVAGSIGTEFIPLPVLEVLPDIDPERFPPPRLDEKTQALAGGWIERYGFLERRNEDRTYPATNPELAALLKDDRELLGVAGRVHTLELPAIQSRPVTGPIRRARLRGVPLGPAARPGAIREARIRGW